MRKTKAQPTIKAKQTIKVPENLRLKQTIYDPYLERLPTYDKKTIVRHLVSKQLTPKKIFTNERLSQNTLLKVRTVGSKTPSHQQSFKIKVSGAGFRRKIGSAITVTPTSHTATNRASTRGRPRMDERLREATSQEMIRAYYSAQHMERESVEKSRKSKQLSKVLSKERFDFQKLKAKSQEVNVIQFPQQLEEEDFQWEDEEGCFCEEGFGVSNNLSFYDFQSLDDPKGEEFILQNKGRMAVCPIYKNKRYSWVQVEILDFDKKNNKVLILRFNKEHKKVSRLSLKFQSTKQQQYWHRIHKAKQLRSHMRQEQKYIRYIDSRSEQYALEEVIKFTPKWDEVQEECHLRYCRQFMVYYDMWRDFESFEKLGLKKRSYNAFKELTLQQPYKAYQSSKQSVQRKHYLSHPRMKQAIFFLRSKLSPTNTQIFSTAPTLTLLQQFSADKLKDISTFMNNFHKHTRQCLISDIIYNTKDRLNKATQRKFYRMYNMMYKDLIISNIYQQNTYHLLHYLEQFTVQPAPSPIIKLQVKVDVSSKSIISLPDMNQLYVHLMKPFNQLVKQVNKVPDVFGQLLFQPVRNMTINHIIEVDERIEEVIRVCYERVQQLMLQMQKHLVYLANIKYQKKTYRPQTLITYASILQQMKQHERQIGYSYIGRSGLLHVSLEPLKQTLIQRIQVNRSRLLRLIEKQVIEQVQKLQQSYTAYHQKLKRKPKNEEQYLQMKNFLKRQCEQFLTDASEKYKLCEEFYDLLESYFHVLKEVEYWKFLEVRLESSLLLDRMDVKKYQLMEVEKMLLEAINDEREEILQGVDEGKVLIEGVYVLGVYEHYRENFKKVHHLYHDLHDYNDRLKNINHRQKLLNQQLSVFPWLLKLIRCIQPYHDMWKQVHDFMIDSYSWRDGSIIGLDYEEVKSKITTFKRQFVRLGKFMDEQRNLPGIGVCETAAAMADGLIQHIWIIECFTKEGLIKKPHMMKEITNEIYGKDAPTDLRTLTMSDLLKKGVEQHEEIVRETSDRAQKIWMLEKKINSVVTNVKQLYLQISSENNIPSIPQPNLLSLQSKIKQQLSIMDMLRCEKQSTYVQKKLNIVYNKLTTKQQTLQSILNFQPILHKITQLFTNKQIIEELPEQQRKVKEVLRVWNNIIGHFEKDTQLWEAIDSEAYRNRVDNMFRVLMDVQEMVKLYLSGKKTIFPRLYFLSDHTIMQIIITNHIPSHCLHLLFNGVTQLNIIQDQIVSVKSQTEQLLLQKPINNTTILWNKLKQLHNEMKAQVQQQLTESKTSKLLCCKLIYEVCALTQQTETHLKKSELEKYAVSLGERVGRKRNYSDMCVSCVYLIWRDKVQHMRKQNCHLSDFHWVGEFKLYEDMTRAGEYYAKCLGMKLELRGDYVGDYGQHAISVYGGDKPTLHRIITLQRINVGAILPSPSSHIIRSISSVLLGHFVECSIPHLQIPLLHLIFGFVSECTWGVLSLSQPTSELLSSISSIAYELQRIIRDKTYYTQHFKTPLKLPPSSLYSLSLSVSQNYSPDHHLLDVCYRSVAISMIDWAYRLQICCSAVGIRPQVVSIVKRMVQLFDVKYITATVQSLCGELMKGNSEDVEKQLVRLVGQGVSSEAMSYLLKQVRNIGVETDDDEQAALKQLMERKKQVIVVGEELSGRTTLIQHAINSTKWTISDGPITSLQQYVIFQTTTIEYITPDLNMGIHIKKSTLSPSQVANKQILLLDPSLQPPVSRYLSLLLPKLACCLSKCIHIIKSFVMSVHHVLAEMLPLHEDEINQLVLMLGYWICDCVGVHVSGEQWDSTLAARSICDYYYDVEKKAWLEWSVLDQPYFLSSYDDFYSIYLPIKESASTLYIASLLNNHSNIIIHSQQRGSGATTILNKLTQSHHTLHHIYMHPSYQPITQLLKQSFIIRQPNGHYIANRQQQMIILIEDISLCKQNMVYWKHLLKYNKQPNSTKQLDRIKFHASMVAGDNDAYMRYFVPVKMREIGDDSVRSVYGYVLDWLFENTDHPFSKQVRNMKHHLIQLSIQLYHRVAVSPLLKYLQGNFKLLYRLLAHLTTASPKTVKNAQHIVNLWIYEANRLCQDAFNHTSCVSEILSSYHIQEVSIHTKVYFTQIHDCYQEVSKEQMISAIKDRLKNMTQGVILYEGLINDIVRVNRMFVREKMHLIKVGLKYSGRRTGVKYGSFIGLGKFPTFVYEQSSKCWKKQLKQYFACVNASNGLENLVFMLDENSSPDFIACISELLAEHQPTALAFDPTLKYLEALSIHSLQSKSYRQFKRKCEKICHFSIVIEYKCASTLFSRYSALMKYSTIVLIQTPENNLKCLESIVEVGVGWFYDNPQKLLKVNEMLIQSTGNRKYQLLKWCLRSQTRYIQASTQLNNRRAYLAKLPEKKEATIKQKKSLQLELARLIPKLTIVKDKNLLIFYDMQRYEKVCDQLMKDFESQDETVVTPQRKQTERLREECEEALSKVGPMLEAAQQSLAKVTKIDIDQLRKFPQPPEPAVKVVEALCFVFGQDHLVKEKVLQSGQKILDYWDYAKKFILNDKILKRVTQFQPDYIKQMKKSQMAELKKITQQPAFQVERVFKASSAAGNLSIWMRAIIDTYEVMEIIQPKKVQLRESEEVLQAAEQKLEQMKREMDQGFEELDRKKQHYKEEMKNQIQLQEQKAWLEKKINEGNNFLKLLFLKETDWKNEVQKQIPKKLSQIRQQSILVSLYEVSLVSYPEAKRQQLTKSISSIFSQLKMLHLSKSLCLPNYDSFCMGKNYPSEGHFMQNLVCMKQEVKTKKFGYMVILDETETLDHFIDGIVVDCLQEEDKIILSMLKDQEIDMDDISEMSPIKSKYSREKSKPTIILKKVQHHSQICKMLISDPQVKFPSINLIIFLTEKPSSSLLPIRVHNQLTPTTMRKFLEHQILSENKNSHLFTKRQQFQHLQTLRKDEEELIWRFLQTENIILDEQALQKWLQCDQRVKKNKLKQVKVKQNNPMMKEIIDKLSIKEHWERANITFKNYLIEVKSSINEKGPEAIYTLNDEISQKLSKVISPHIRILQRRDKSNVFVFLHNKLQEYVYAESLEFLKFYIQNQKTIFFLCLSKRHAYRLGKQIAQYYNQFIEKQLQTFDDFDSQAHGFYAYLALLEQSSMPIDKDWMLTETSGEAKSISFHTQLCKKTLDFLPSNYRKYCIETLTN